ncbi:hypothetical protein LTS15_010572 [Exophiala xenobiotica]|nr:hypothetical protein LTS15_010572 [Exophiala xenobiotica]
MSLDSSIEHAERLLHNLNIAENVVQSRRQGQEQERSTRDQLVPLQTSIRTLYQATNNVTSQVQSVESLANDANSAEGLSIAEVCSLHGEIKKLEKAASNIQAALDALHEVTHHSIFLKLSSYEGRGGIVRNKILPHFEKQIKDIISDVLNDNGDTTALWKVAEECYDQATKPFGKLDVENYFAPLEEAYLQWPYDPDFESEEYYEHENRLDVDEDYAAAFQEKIQRRSDARQQDRKAWPKFWIAVLNEVPDGPTLFCPPARLHTPLSFLEDVPRYLFRTFDGASSGKNDSSVVASIASVLMPSKSRHDLLSMDEDRVTQLLYQHLNKSCFGGDGSDNLMSWTSSLLFAIQYGIWRANIRGISLSDVKICAVDTSNFPKGQFVQDLCLLEAYRVAAQDADKDTREFFRFRLETDDFYNGEYLSQGQVNHAGRSCVATLEHLLNSGLRQLYPEFEDPRGAEKWTKRVLELRRNWSSEQFTTDQEIELALEVARRCFEKYNSSEIALILLGFKNRKHSRLESTDNPGQFNRRPPKWAEKPVEVHRYWIATEGLHCYSRYPQARINGFFSTTPQSTTVREILS